MTEPVLAAWLVQLEKQHPKSIDLGLERVRAVANQLDLLNPSYKSITVAGTNGKGSCVASLDQLLRDQGLSVGVYTSPHLRHYNERIVIDGEPASDNDIVMAFSAIEKASVEVDVSLSYFEYATLAGLWLFKRAGVSWQILEVGLGGRLDAVNIIDADACVVTSIGLDHTEWLGDSRDLIAIEKAGVARQARPAVIAESDVPETLRATLEALDARVYQVGHEWQLHDSQLTLPSGLTLPLVLPKGLQPQNVAAAAVVLDVLGVNQGASAIRASLSTVQVAGRQQQLNWCDRDVWCDVAHNRESVEALVAALDAEPSQGACHAVFAGMSDKPLLDMINLMSSHVNYWHLPPLSGLARAAEPEAVAALLGDQHCKCYDSIENLSSRLFDATEAGDRIVVFGSFVTVGALLSQFDQRPSPITPPLNLGADAQ